MHCPPRIGTLHILIAGLKVLKLSDSQIISTLYYPEGSSEITQHPSSITTPESVPSSSDFLPIRGAVPLVCSLTRVPHPLHWTLKTLILVQPQPVSSSVLSLHYGQIHPLVALVNRLTLGHRLSLAAEEERPVGPAVICVYPEQSNCGQKVESGKNTVGHVTCMTWRWFSKKG